MNALRVVMLCFLSGLGLFPSIVASSKQDSTMTERQAIAWVRATKYAHVGSEFRVLREIKASPESQEVAEQALLKSEALHIGLANDGIFLHLLQEGGYSVLEYSSARHQGIGLYLVTRTAEGNPQVFPLALEGKPSLGAVIDATSGSEVFLREFYTTEPSKMGILLDRYLGGKVPTYNPSTIQNYTGEIDFSVPVTLANAFDSERVKYAGVLSWGLYNWVLRWAVSTPAFSANPDLALDEARETILTEVKSFVISGGHGPDYALTLNDLGTIRSEGQLSERIDELARLNAHLEQVLGPQIDPTVFKWNMELSLFPTSVLAVTDAKTGENLLYVASAPEIGTTWRMAKNGSVTLQRVERVLP